MPGTNLHDQYLAHRRIARAFRYATFIATVTVPALAAMVVIALS